jgi:ferric-chelate reductase
VKPFSFDPYIIATFAIWGLDRFMRVGRMIYFSLANRYGSSAQVKAKATLVSPYLVRLSVPRPKGYHWSPGQTAFLTLPTISAMPWESHPFTIASIDGSKTTYNLVDDLVFLVATRSGFTGRLKSALLSQSQAKLDEQPTLEIPVAVVVDGPYGSFPIMEHHDTIVLIAGGSGIAHTLPVLQSLIWYVAS